MRVQREHGEGATEEETLNGAPDEDSNCPDISVSLFDYSVQNHFRVMDTIAELCGEAGTDLSRDSEVGRLSSAITFLREWRHFNYKPKVVRFAYEMDSPQGRDVSSSITLPQFSSAAIPKKGQNAGAASLESSKDFVMYSGGPVWAMDWCPRIREKSDNHIKCEFIAVSSHPPDSSYHKMGVPLVGRGVVQIWCVLNVSVNGDEVIPTPEKKTKPKISSDLPDGQKRPRGRPRKNPINDSADSEAKKPRGRPRKHPKNESLDNLDLNNQLVVFQPTSGSLDICVNVAETPPPAENPKEGCMNEEVANKSLEQKKPRGRPRRRPINVSSDNINSIYQTVELQPNICVIVPETSSPAENPKEGCISKELPKDKSVEPKKRGRGKRKPINESLGDTNSIYQSVVLQPVSEPSIVRVNVVEMPPPTESPKPGAVSKEATKNKSTGPMKIKGKGRKKPLNLSVDDMSSNNQLTGSQTINNSSDVCINEAEALPPIGSPKHGAVNKEVMENKATEPSQARGTCRKKPINDSSDNVSSSDQVVQTTALQLPADDSELLIKYLRNANEDAVSVNHGKKRKGGSIAKSSCNSSLTTSASKKLKCTVVTQSHAKTVSQSEGKESSITNLQTDCSPGEHLVACNSISNNSCLDISLVSNSIPKDVALPKLVLCLAHNGKVAWDVKWRPSNACNPECKLRMGYLAVLLGNGSLEVWEVPLPQTIKTIYSSSQRKDTDPRFVKLKPVFRCSKLTSGGVQSIPLSVEWSNLPPHDVLLAGCHDGTVALWKFSASGASEDTRPLLHFTADTAPIRAVVWAPTERDPESSNVIATAGHGGLKFWDIRDPYRPLWDLHQVPKIIYSMDWDQDTRCVILSFEDGALRFFSLVNSAYDGPVTGISTLATKQPGFHTYSYSSFAIWHIQVSRATGMVAYCGEDGAAVCFQLTTRAVEKGASRYRSPRYLCGSVTEEESIIVVNTPSPETPLPLKAPPNESGESLKSIEGPSPDQAKKSAQKTKEQSSDLTLALCYEDDPSTEPGHEETPAASQTKKPPKPKSKKKASGADMAMICPDEEEPSNGKVVEEEENGTREGGKEEFEVFPPKAAAMHRVRWNVNKGSERWLCFGGAAGLVRCQEISMSYLDQKLYMKR